MEEGKGKGRGGRGGGGGLTLNVEIIQPQQRNRIIDIKPESKRPHKIGSLLNRARVGRHFGRPQLDSLALHVHAALQLEVLDQRRVDLGPGGLEGRHAMGRNGDLAVLHADDIGGGGFRGGREAGAAFFVDEVVELHLRIGL